MTQDKNPPRRKFMYQNDVSEPDFKIDNQKTVQKESIPIVVDKPNRKLKHKEIIVPEVVKDTDLNTPSKVQTKTSNFSVFLSTLKIYLDYTRSNSEDEDVDLILQMFISVYRLESNFDNLIDALQAYLKTNKEESILHLIKVYYKWTTGLMMAEIQTYPHQKIYYDSIIKIISKYSDKQ